MTRTNIVDKEAGQPPLPAVSHTERRKIHVNTGLSLPLQLTKAVGGGLDGSMLMSLKASDSDLSLTGAEAVAAARAQP